eukprot:TRINITY_DN1742_c0_g1_i2.p1 TRINITY_DN1742_c0_g1~~TRINITY_DN1742_c0_g1_i2.p1  ORF type:complete len:107 (+),score=14.43 TRINITY_DN1742_c0_g1_i2:41-361(+)
MGDEKTKAPAVIPASLLKKRKRKEDWEKKKAAKSAVAKFKRRQNRKLIRRRAKQHAKEYHAQARELIRLKREEKLKCDFYLEAEAEQLLVIRIRRGVQLFLYHFSL